MQAPKHWATFYGDKECSDDKALDAMSFDGDFDQDLTWLIDNFVRNGADDWLAIRVDHADSGYSYKIYKEDKPPYKSILIILHDKKHPNLAAAFAASTLTEHVTADIMRNGINGQASVELAMAYSLSYMQGCARSNSRKYTTIIRNPMAQSISAGCLIVDSADFVTEIGKESYDDLRAYYDAIVNGMRWVDSHLQSDDIADAFDVFADNAKGRCGPQHKLLMKDFKSKWGALVDAASALTDNTMDQFDAKFKLNR